MSRPVPSAPAPGLCNTTGTANSGGPPSPVAVPPPPHQPASPLVPTQRHAPSPLRSLRPGALPPSFLICTEPRGHFVHVAPRLRSARPPVPPIATRRRRRPPGGPPPASPSSASPRAQRLVRRCPAPARVSARVARTAKTQWFSMRRRELLQLLPRTPLCCCRWIAKTDPPRNLVFNYTTSKFHYNPCSTTWIRQVPRRPSLAKIDYTVMRQVPLSTTLDDYKNVYHYRRPSKTPWTPNIYGS